MDTMNNIKNFLNKLYSNKYFKFIFLTLIIILIIVKYSNVKNIINIPNDEQNSSNKKEVLTEPQKVNIFKKVQILPTAIYKENKEKNEERIKRIENYRKNEKAKQELVEQREKEVENYRKEFSQSNSNKKSKKIKIGDKVDFRMLITNGNDFYTFSKPIEITIIITKDINNIFAKYLIGKRKGDLILIPFNEFMKEKIIQNSMKMMENEYKKNNLDINLNSLNNSNIIYRIKIIKVISNKKS